MSERRSDSQTARRAGAYSRRHFLCVREKGITPYNRTFSLDVYPYRRESCTAHVDCVNQLVFSEGFIFREGAAG